MRYFLKYVAVLSLSLFLPLIAADDSLYLRDNLKMAEKGDYLVTTQGRMVTMLHIFDRTPNRLTIEEISIPQGQIPLSFQGWRDWLQKSAPGNTSWVIYLIEIPSGNLLQAYSMTRRSWIKVSEANNFLTNLLNLKFNLIPDWQKKKAGPPPLLGVPDRRKAWQPRLILDGEEIKDVQFDAYRAQWPKDKTILSDKTIDIYLPKEKDRYPVYFPYWLQISGMVGKAQVHIIDSGHHLKSPTSLPKGTP